MEKFLQTALANSDSKLFHRINNFLALLTIVSILGLVLETVPSLESYSTWFLWLEWVAVIFFTLEYLGRLKVSQPKRHYVFSFFGLVDLISILPTFLGLGNFTFLKSARALRIIRLLRMLRLAKIARGNLIDEDSLSVLSLNILIYMATLVFALLVTGTAMYIAEPDLAAFVSIPSSMWWSFKVFLSNIPVMQPETDWGQFFYVLTRFIGLLLLGLLVGVVGNIFRALVFIKQAKK